MDRLFFVTGNKGKLREVQVLIPDVQGIDLDLTEIQDSNPLAIIEAKLAEARKVASIEQAGFLVEDTSLFIDGMNGLPGPFIKWFLKTISIEGVYKLTEAFGTRATAKTLLGFSDEHGHLSFFEGAISGMLVPPRGTDGFGWDSIFQPDNHQKTFAEMTPAEKNEVSMRRLAVTHLQRHLEQVKVRAL